MKENKKTGNIHDPVSIQRWISELEKLKIPEYDPYNWPGARSLSFSEQGAAQKAADIGIWRRRKDRGWSTSTGTMLADIVLTVDGRDIGIFSDGDGRSVIKFNPPSKKSRAVIEKIIALVKAGIPTAPIDLEWESEFQKKYPYSTILEEEQEDFIGGIQRLIDTGRLWEDIYLADRYKKKAYSLIMAGKCRRWSFDRDR